MRTLLLILQFPPDVNPTGVLMYDIAQGLSARGHEITVLTAFPHYEKFRVWEEYRGKFRQRTREKNLNVERVYVFANGKKQNMNYRLLSYLSFNAIAGLSNLFARERYDVILCPNGGFFTGIAAYLSGVFKRTPFVYNVQDLYPETPVAQGQLTSKRAIAGLERIERFMYRVAKHITVITPSFRANLLHQKSVPQNKVSVIPNFVNTEFIHPLPKENEFTRQHGLENKFVVMYAGNFGYVYALDTLLDAAAQLRAERDLIFLLIGDGVARPALEQRARELGLDNVRFLEYQPRERLPELRAAADVQLCLYRAGAAQYSMPSKLYEIMASGRPVLASAEAGSDVANLIAETQCGMCVEPQNVKQIVQALLELKHNSALRAQLGHNGRSAAEQRFSLETVVNQYDVLLRQVANASLN
jgi:colanic acid biosynthesis glycosyl transferase WcaI